MDYPYSACSKCGRFRPSYITDPTCEKGGYCDWRVIDPVALWRTVIELLSVGVTKEQLCELIRSTE